MRNRLVTLVAVLVVSACGGGGGVDGTTTAPTSTAASPGTTAASPGTTAGEAPGTTGAPSSGDEAGGVVTVEGVEYQVSAADGITAGGATMPTRCEANYFGIGLFWVVATAVDEKMARSTDPQVSLSLTLFPTMEAAEAADQEVEFTLKVTSPSDSSQTREYLLATDDSVVAQAGEYDGDLGSWTIEENRIFGEIAVYEYDHIREYTTASFDITCPTQ